MSYDARYELELIRGVEEPRPWNIVEEIEKTLSPNARWLDISCGTAHKMLPLIDGVAAYVGLDNSEAMLEKAKANVTLHKKTNASLVTGDFKKLPFENQSFENASCVMGLFNPEETRRVLKPRGKFVAELLDDNDKKEIKDFFKSDKLGRRGWRHYYEGLSAQERINQCRTLFSEVTARFGEWKAEISLEGLCLLSELTKLVQRFDRRKDAAILNELSQAYPSGKIPIVHRRYLLICES